MGSAGLLQYSQSGLLANQGETLGGQEAHHARGDCAPGGSGHHRAFNQEPAAVSPVLQGAHARHPQRLQECSIHIIYYILIYYISYISYIIILYIIYIYQYKSDDDFTASAAIVTVKISLRWCGYPLCKGNCSAGLHPHHQECQAGLQPHH